jgi:hypothetical protein
LFGDGEIREDDPKEECNGVVQVVAVGVFAVLAKVIQVQGALKH